MEPRLIDANKLNREDLCNLCRSADCANCFSDEAFEKWITTQPTAYDIDKVVEQLEEMQNFEERTGKCYCPDANEEDCRYAFSDLSCAYCSIEKAIEIVKGGADNG